MKLLLLNSLFFFLVGVTQLYGEEKIVAYSFDTLHHAINDGAVIKELILENGYSVSFKPYTGFARHFVTGIELTLKFGDKTIACVDADYIIGCRTALWIAQPSGNKQAPALTIHQLADGYKKHGGTEWLRLGFLNISFFSAYLPTFEPDLKIQSVIIDY